MSAKAETSRGVMGPPTMAASKRPVVVGSLSARKPNLHLTLGETLEPMSRFSAFSSNEGTPSNEHGRRARAGKDSPSDSPSTSNGFNSSVGTPAVDAGPMAGLGIGMTASTMPSPRALNDLSALSAASSQSLSTVISGASNTTLTKPPPQTPDRLRLGGTEQSNLHTPAGTYDRADQIGIGELSTPRWTTNSGVHGWTTDPNTVTAFPTERNASQTTRRGEEGEARHARAISFSVTAPVQTTKQSGNEYHLATLSPERHAGLHMVPSPSMPSYGPSLGGVSSLASLAHNFTDHEERVKAMKATRQSSDSASRRDLDTPDYSINALSESEDDLVADMVSLSVKNSTRSPRIGDSAWSEEETGPFAIATPSSQSGRDDARQRREKSEQDETVIRRQENDSPGGSEQRGSFDLNAAIADLANVEETRRKARRAAGWEAETEAPSPRSSIDVTNASSRHASQAAAAPPSATPTRRRETSERERPMAETAIPHRRSRRTSSPGSTMTKTTSMARLPSSSSSQSISSTNKKRSSSASIGHSLLRGSLPFGASEEFEGRLSGADDAAEALRKLDGVGNSTRNSLIRERDSSKSPRSSKQLSRPSSAGRRTPGSASRPSSPSNKNRESMSANRHQREESVATKSSASRRTSRSMGKRSGDEATASPQVGPIDSPKRTSFSSPRIKRAPLPPLPSHNVAGLSSPPPAHVGLAGPAPSERTRDASKRASAASIASATSASRSLGTSTAKGKRASDVSLLDSQSFGGPAGLGLANAEEKLANAGTPPSSGTLFVPPVPPLPKAWEGTRTASMQSTETASDSPNQISPNTSANASTQSIATQQHLTADQVSASAPTMSKKWSFSNLGGVLATKRSEERLTARKSTGASMVTPAATPLDDDKTVISRRRLSARPGSESTETAVRRAQQGRGSVIRPPSASRKELLPTDGAVAPTPAAASQEVARPAKSPSLAASSSPKSRRTPSFFRKRSNDTSMDDSLASPQIRRPSHEQKESASVGSQEGVDKQRTEATTPSGRSSRKSILGIGNLLRSASKRNVDSMPTSASVASNADRSVESIAGDDSTSTQDSSSRIMPSLTAIRRSSLIGRKRGKVGVEM